jgi:hypothetical protein
MKAAVVVSAAVVGGVALGPASADPMQTRVVDRTALCAVGLSGGVHELEVEAQSASGTRADPNRGYVTVRSNVRPIGFFASLTQDVLDLNPACRRSRTAASLSARGLIGGTAGTTYETFDCTTPPRVLVRVRVSFARPVRLRRTTEFRHPQLTARAPVKEGTIADRTEAGRPVVVARLFPSGRVQVLTDVPRSCIPD